nr:hypothetical protein [Tanacetum cinerariifolium]
KFVRKTPNSSQRPSRVCAKCGNPVDGHYCRHCALLRKKLKEVWFKICDEQNSFQDLLNTSDSSNDDSNVVNAPQEPITVSSVDDVLMSLVGKVLLLAWDRVSEIKNAVGNKQYKLEDVQELFCKLLYDVQNIHEELAEYINILSWNNHAFSSHDDDDDENYTIAITPEEPNNSLSIGDEHLDTIPATESDEVIKYSVEDLVPISSESEGILDNTCDVPFHDNSLPFDVFEEQFKEFSDSNNDSTLIDDDYFSVDNIDYIELSPPDSELVSLEENNDSTTIHADISLSNLECFNFKREPNLGELTSIVNFGIRENILSATNVNLPPEEDHSPLFAYVVWIFLSFLTYPIVPPYLFSFGNKDTIFDPGIANYHFPSLLPDVSHRCGTFMKFNVHPNHLNESSMEILSSTTFLKDQ